MAIGDLGFDFAAVKTRLGRVFVSADDGTTWVEIGRCRDVKLTWQKLNTAKDQQGRTKMLAADITANIVLTQTSETEFDNIGELINPAGNGLQVKFTDAFATTATAGAAAGKTLVNAIFTADGELDWSGGDSFIPMTIEGRIAATDLSDFGTSGTITF